MAHALCPFCYPTDPAVGEQTIYWCGTKQIFSESAVQVPRNEPRCPKCLLTRACVSCGAQLTSRGVVAPEELEDA